MDRELFLALESGDVTEIQRLHRQNTRVLLGVTFQGDNPLHIAAREDHLPIVKWILQVKPSLAGARNEDLNTPLHEAAKSGNREVVDILLQHKKNSAYYSNKFRETALIIASRYGHLETVMLFLKARSYNDGTEMHRSFRVAAYGRYPDVAQAIVDNPIKPRGLCRLLRVLLQCDTYRDVAKAGFDYLRNLYRESVNKVAILNLHSAIHGGDPQIVKAVLNSPAWKDYLMTMKDDCGWCAIHVAAMKGSSEIINEFMSRWPDCVEIRNSDHKSVLHIAVEYNQFNIVQNLLLNKSPQRIVDLVSRYHDCFHNTALHLAAKNGVNSELLDFLLSPGSVVVNAVNDEGMTALDIACVAAKDSANCSIITQKLEDAGGIRVSLMPKSDTTSVPSNDSKEGGDKEIIDTQIVVASLIATVTFAAIFQIPGGIEEDKNSIHYGVAKMAFHKLFKVFIISDVAAFISSFLVVVAWLLRQLLGDTHLGRTLALSHPSVMTLLFSILWTTAAFVSATIIVTVPSNFKDLKSTHKKAFSAYGTLLALEMELVIFSAIYVGVPLFSSVFVIFKWGRRIKYYKNLLYVELCVVTMFFLLFTFGA